MVAKSELQFAGEFLVEECQIVSTTGKIYDINPLVEEINVFENIYTAAISGDIVIKDTTNIVQNLPIIGEERLILKIQTPQLKPEPETTIDYTLSPLIIYKINSYYEFIYPYVNFLIYQHLSPLAEFPAIIYIFYQWLTGMH